MYEIFVLVTPGISLTNRTWNDNSSPVEITFRTEYDYNQQIGSQICRAVVTCAKLWSDHIIILWVETAQCLRDLGYELIYHLWDVSHSNRGHATFLLGVIQRARPWSQRCWKNNCQATAFIKYFSKTLLTLSPSINLFSVDNCLSCQLSFAKKDYDIGFRVTPILEWIPKDIYR